MYSVSVIVPIYNVEKYIAKCATSLFEQTLSSIQYIFINDCSQDNSMEILNQIIKKYPNRSKDVIIVDNVCNQGVAYTRNKGRDLASGNYIIDCDSDDWIDTNAYEKMYNKALDTDSDIVICGLAYEYENKTIYIEPTNYETAYNYFRKSLIGAIHNSCCNKLIRAELYRKNDIRCLNNINMLEDTIVMTRLFYNANKITIVNDLFYHYFQGNNRSYTHNWSQNNFDNIIIATDYLFNYFTVNNARKYSITSDLNFLKLNSKVMLLIYSDKKNRNRYHKLYNESENFIWIHPTLNFHYKMFLYFSSIGLIGFSNLIIYVIKQLKRFNN